jgi:hypothetical protein
LSVLSLEASDKVSGGKWNVKWDVVCTPKSMGGLGILDLEKFKRALRLRWPWYEWIGPGRDWVGLGNPWNDDEMRLFYASINFTIWYGKTSFQI